MNGYFFCAWQTHDADRYIVSGRCPLGVVLYGVFEILRFKLCWFGTK